jgi:hypothetical protein
MRSDVRYVFGATLLLLAICSHVPPLPTFHCRQTIPISHSCAVTIMLTKSYLSSFPSKSLIRSAGSRRSKQRRALGSLEHAENWSSSLPMRRTGHRRTREPALGKSSREPSQTIVPTHKVSGGVGMISFMKLMVTRKLR